MAKILIVDDSWLTRKGIANILQIDGYEILEASTGKAGLKIVEKIKPDCILLDLLMPELDGFSVLETLRDSSFNIPTIIITADIQETTREKCLELGAIDFINKPPDENEIRNMLKRIIPRR